MHRRVGIIIILFFSFFSGNAQPATLIDKSIIFEQLPNQLGLSQRSVNHIMQDSDGYLWIGTWSGLVRYDGKRSEVFLATSGNDKALQSNKVTSLAEGMDGNIWVGTRAHGVFIFDKSKEIFTSLSDKYPGVLNKNIWDIDFGPQGTIWLATENGLVRIRNNEVHTINTVNGLSDNFVTSVYIDKKEQIWATTENGLNLLSSTSNEIKHYFFEDDIESRELHNYFYECGSVSFEGEQVLFVSSKKGLKKLHNGKLSNHIIGTGQTAFNLLRSIATIQDNRPLVLVGSEMGLNIFDLRSDEFIGFYGNFDEQVNLSHNTVTDIYLDASAVLWIGTKKGINKFDTYDKGIKLYKNEVFNPTKSILTGISGSNQDVFISTMGGGLIHFNYELERFTNLKLSLNEENDFSDFIQKLYVDPTGHVNIGTAGAGVYRFNPMSAVRDNLVTEYSNFSYTKGTLSDDYIMSFGGSNDGGVWVGTWSGGLNKIYNNGNHVVYDDSLLVSSPIVDIHQTGEGLWIGTRGNGLIFYTVMADKLVNPVIYSPGLAQKISSDFISDIFEDKLGRLWVGTEEGLDLFDPETSSFVTFNTESGLFTNEVISLQEDKDGQLWLANWQGLTLIEVEDHQISSAQQFDRSDRLQGEFFYNEVTYRDDDGRVYFGGANGFNVIELSKVVINPFQPKTIISSMSVFDSPIKPEVELNGRRVIEKRIQEVQKVELRHDENSIRIEFASLHFAAPEKNKYSYFLEGFDSDWNETDQNRPFSNYTNLKDGVYTFRLKSSNNDGLWQSEGMSLEIVILPPWWKTTPAFAGAAVFIMLLLLGFRYLIIARTQYESNIKYERLERENLEKINKAKLRFFTNVSHEFRTPLTLILGPLENLGKTEFTDKFAKNQLNIIRNNTYRLLRLVNQLLDFRKTESGNMQLRAAEGNFVQFVKEVKLSFESEAESKQIDFGLHASSNIINLYFDRDQFEKILFNLLSNAFKHTDENGKISIKIIEHKNDVELVVEDSGDGIPEEHMDKVFDRFYSADEEYSSGTGIGLALVKSLVELHKGTIDFNSKIGEKTSFHLLLKKGREHLADTDVIADFTPSEVIENYKQVEDPAIAEPEQLVGDIEDFNRILIVEDNDEIRGFIKSIFIRDYIVLEAKNGEEGLDIAQEEIPDLVISDVMMPIMDGIKFCKMLKSNIKTSHIPVILLTARTSLIFKVDGYESGADDYVTKPFESNLLRIRVENLIKQREKLRKLYGGSNTAEIEPSLISFTSADEKFINEALASVEKNIANSEYNVQDLGKDVGMSRMQLYRKLKSMLGQSANEFIRTIRLKRAAQLLEAKEFTVAEVTYMCGFTDLQYFRKCFRKQFGVNPSEYQNSDITNEEDI